MPGGRELNRLELRRRELVLQSTLNRLAIMTELQNVQAALRPADRVITSIRAARSWLLLLAPLAGIFAARTLRGNGSGFSRLFGALKYIQPLLALWRQFSSSTNNGESGGSGSAEQSTRFSG